jgi:tetratricopeptide (TPR) repeat protein
MEHFEEIEKYLNGELSDQEKIDFERQLSTDSEIRKNLNLLMEVNEYIDNRDDELKMQMTVKEIIQRRGKQRQSIFQKYVFSSIWTKAATIIILIGFIGMSAIILESSKNQRIFNKYYNHYEFSDVVRSENGTASNETLNKALHEYTIGNYELALTYFEKLEISEKEQVVSQFLQAISYIEIEQANKAIILLEKLSKYDHMYHETIVWYLGLCYLKIDNIDKAQPVFSQLSSYNNYYSEQASSILNRLK